MTLVEKLFTKMNVMHFKNFIFTEESFCACYQNDKCKKFDDKETDKNLSGIIQR